MLPTRNKSDYNILILGLGGVGYYLAKRLVHEGHAVTIIESDPAKIRYADGNIDARLIRGNAMGIECWQEAGASQMDFLIAVTNNDAVNMMACLIGDRFGIRRKIARVRATDLGKPDSLLTSEDLKIDFIIHPEELAAQEIVRLIKMGSGNEIIDIAGGDLQVIASRVPDDSPMIGKQLWELSQQYDFPFRVVAIARGITTIIPGGGNQILPQDQIFVMASRQDLPKVMELTNLKQDSRSRVMILGGGLVGSRVAQLLDRDIRVKLVERDQARAEELTHDLPHTEVLHGNGSDAGDLDLAGLMNIDTFITATGDNETNIMSCVMVKHLMEIQSRENGRRSVKTIAMVQNEDYLVLAATMGTDIALNKKVLAGNEILQFIRRGRLLSMAHLHGFDAEVVELVAAPDSQITKRPLSKLAPSHQGKILVGGVHRDGIWNLGTGDTHIRGEERALVICKSLHLKDVQQLFLA